MPRKPVPDSPTAVAASRHPVWFASVFLALLLACTMVAAQPASAAGQRADGWASDLGGSTNAASNPSEKLITATSVSSVRQAWQLDTGQTGQSTAPPVVNGVVYYASNPGNATDPGVFHAADVRTGALLWSLTLPASQYYVGMAASGNLVVAGHEGWHDPAGITAINRVTHRVAWNISFGNDANGQAWTSSARLVVDAGHVYTITQDGLTAYRLRDGALLWSHPYAYPDGLTGGIAAHGGTLFAGQSNGLVAYDGATGRVLWSAAGGGLPVVAGGRVFLTTYFSGTIWAYSERGCGKPTCRPLWSNALTTSFVNLGAASSSTLYATYSTTGPDGPVGHLTRVDSTTGRVLDDVALPGTMSAPIRAANLTWVVTNRVLHGSYVGFAMEAYRVTGHPSLPVASIRQPSDAGFPQGLAVSDGSLVYQQWGGPITGYRIPRT